MPQTQTSKEVLPTQGEWKVVNIGGIKRVRQSTKTICDCYSFSEGISDEEAEANAELIVKAVNERQKLLDNNRELLNALKLANAALKEITEDAYGNTSASSIIETAINNAKNI